VSLHDFLACRPALPEILRLHLQGIGRYIQESSRPGGAFVIHGKIGHIAFFIDADALAVLAPDVDNGPDAWKRKWIPAV